MKANALKVTVKARQGTDLKKLSRFDGPLSNPCGLIGPNIANSVLSGNGKSEVLLNDLRLAMDTQSGVEAIMDNFALYDSKTGKSLLLFLIAKYVEEL